MKYSDETKSDFVARIMAEKGFGTVTRIVAPPKPIIERSRAEIAAEQCEREAAYFSHLYLTAPRPYSEVAE